MLVRFIPRGFGITVNVKRDERRHPIKINHVTDIEKLLGVDNLDEFISNTSF